MSINHFIKIKPLVCIKNNLLMITLIMKEGMIMNQEKIGKFISELRKEKNLTQSDLAEQLDVSINAVSKWERGLSMMDISLLKPLSEILDISVSELLNGQRIDKVDDKIINDTITASTNIYVKKEKKKFIKKVLITISIFIILLFTILTIISEFNYGRIPFGSKAYMDFPNLNSLHMKTNADKCMNLIIDKDIDNLDNLVVSNRAYLLLEDSKTIAEEQYKKLSNDVHLKSYIDNLRNFYKDVKVKNYKYNYFYYDGSNYVYDYYLNIAYDNKDYTLDIQITPYKEKVAFTSFGFRDDDVEMYSTLYNLIYSVLYW